MCRLYNSAWSPMLRQCKNEMHTEYQRAGFLCFFHHEAHEEHKEIIKSINSNPCLPQASSCPFVV